MFGAWLHVQTIACPGCDRIKGRSRASAFHELTDFILTVVARRRHGSRRPVQPPSLQPAHRKRRTHGRLRPTARGMDATGGRARRADAAIARADTADADRRQADARADRSEQRADAMQAQLAAAEQAAHRAQDAQDAAEAIAAASARAEAERASWSRWRLREVARAIGAGREPKLNHRCFAAQRGDVGRMGCNGMDEVLVRVLVTVTAAPC